jgi:hypothetical protein
MKMFLRKIGLFLLFLLFVMILWIEVLSILNRRVLRRYKLEPSVTSVIMGDSHVQCAFDDRRLAHAVNLSQPAEAYMFSYFKLKGILEGNPQIRMVMLGCSYHNFSSYYDKRIFGEDSNSVSERYFFILPTRQQLQVLTNSEENFVSYLRSTLKTGYYNVTWARDRFSFIGGFMNPHDRTGIDSEAIKKRINGQYYFEDRLAGFSDVNISYLDKIAALCKDKNVELVILRAPMHTAYLKQVPLKFKEKFDSFMATNSLKQVHFDGLNLADSCFLPDGDHVSYAGALLATDSLKVILEKGLISQTP